MVCSFIRLGFSSLLMLTHRKFMASVDPENASHDLINEEEDVEVQMPSPEAQGFLLHLYFAYVHPFFPVIHKQDFLFHYNAL